jgi:hypothetical protein
MQFANQNYAHENENKSNNPKQRQVLPQNKHRGKRHYDKHEGEQRFHYANRAAANY